MRFAGNVGSTALMAPEPDPFSASRAEMVREQLLASERGITDPRVIAAMSEVPRHLFVPPEHRHLAYSDRALPIAHGQTISQPCIVALMTQLLQLKPGDRVLEIGTGSGYQTAILSKLAAGVWTIEILPELGHAAAALFDRLGLANIQCRIGDGFDGWPEAAPFDAIIVTCAPDSIPPPLVSQLKEGGHLAIPVGASDAQELVLMEKHDDRLDQHSALRVRFVPMTGKAREQ